MAEPLFRRLPNWSRTEQAFRDLWRDATPGQRRAFIEALRVERPLLCSYRQVESLVDHWASPEYRDNLPAYALEIALEVLRTPEVLEPLHAIEHRVLLEERRRMRKVEPLDRSNSRTGVA